jgi:anthranilate synthase component I
VSAPELPLGTVLPLSRRLDAAPDPLALYNKLTGGGARKNTLLFETADATRGSSLRSFLVEATALRATCRNRRVLVEALSASGELALEAVAATFEATGFIQERSPRALTLAFPRADGSGDAEQRLKAPSPLDVLRAMSTRFTVAAHGSPRAVFCAGVFSYDLVDTFEALPPAASDPLSYPDYVFWLAESLISIDGHTGQAQVLCPAFGSADPHRAAVSYNDAAARLARLVERCAEPCEPPAPAPAHTAAADALDVDLDDDAYAAAVVELKQRIVAGDVFQIVPSRMFRAPCPAPLAAYAELRRINPSPYMLFVAAEDHTLFGASPETCVKVSCAAAGGVARADRTLHICPIAGTRRRGRAADGSIDRDLDDRLEAELRLHDKEVAEHMMLVDLARNDVARVSRPGTRHVAQLLSVQRYSHVMHLASEVVGVLRDDLDALHAYQASMNMGTLVGAPKVRAAELLRTAEATKRGPYGGAVGYLDNAGELDTAIVIRSAVVKDGLAYVRAGAGVVYDSDPALEADETRRKAQAVLSAIHVAHGGGATPQAAPSPPRVGADGDGREVLFIDNFDSFTFNLVESFERLGCRVRVFRNTVDAGRVMELARAGASLIVLSPGPGGPEDAGCCMELIARARGQVPLLGVCLGHQAIVKEAGGDVASADRIVHGKASMVAHDGAGPFLGLPSPLLIGRYHSLATRCLPSRFRVHASLGDMAMAISDPVARQVGVQFHPESVLTPFGDGLLRNILALMHTRRA